MSVIILQVPHVSYNYICVDKFLSVPGTFGGNVQ